MATNEHLALLKQGVDVWNQWRKEHINIVPDLSGVDLSNRDFGNADLSGADLSGANLSRTNLRKANFRRARLFGADLSRANLRKANLRKADLSGADLRRANLRRADLSGANLSQANLRGANLSRTDLSEADLSTVDFRRTNLINAVLNKANLTGAKLWETQSSGWSIKGLICEHAFWDRNAKEPTNYEPGEFERLQSEALTVAIRYKGGIRRIEVNTLPMLLQQLEKSNDGCVLRLRSIEDAPGGAKATIVVEQTGGHDPAELQTSLQEQAQSHQDGLRWLIDENPQILEQLWAKMSDQISENLFSKLLEHTGSHDKALVHIDNVETIEKIEKVGIVGTVTGNAKIDIDQ